MAGGFITVREMMDEMRSGAAFTITWVTADRKRETGGQILHLINAVLVQRDPKTKKKKDFVSAATVADEDYLSGKKNPRHFENDTINLMKRGTQQIRKAHVMLITVFNGKPVID